MKKLLIFLFCLIFIAPLSIGGAWAIADSEVALSLVNDLSVDTNVYKGEINGKDSILIYADVRASKYDSQNEYGIFVYKATVDRNITLSMGVLNPSNTGDKSYGIRFDADKFEKDVEYSAKAYVKDQSGEIKLSRTTAYFIVCDDVHGEFEIYLSSADVTYDAQDKQTVYASSATTSNVQYLVYRDGEFIGATNDLRYNVVDALFASDGTIEQKEHSIKVVTVSGLDNGKTSKDYTFSVKYVNDVYDFIDIGGDNSNNMRKSSNIYYVLNSDIEIDAGTVFKTYRLENERYYAYVDDIMSKVQSVIRYFSDTIDGRGHKIKLSYDKTDEADVYLGGLFGVIEKTGAIRNLVYEADIIHAGNSIKNVAYRYTALAMISAGYLENCYFDVKMQSKKTVWRECTIGFPDGGTCKNIVARQQLFDKNGELATDLSTDNAGKTYYGSKFIWESAFTPEFKDFIMVSPSKLGTNYNIG